MHVRLRKDGREPPCVAVTVFFLVFFHNNIIILIYPAIVIDREIEIKSVRASA